MKLGNNWHTNFFKNSFYNPASPAAVERAPHEARFVLRQLKLSAKGGPAGLFGGKKGSALLDLCCGPGRHAVEFAKKGLKVTGYDFSKEYLKEAAARAKKRKVTLRLTRGDMRALKYKSEFDAAVNLFTSFGYFQKFSDDLKVLKAVARGLKPGGLFMLDIVHGEFVRKTFHPRSWARMPDGSYHLEERVLKKDGLFNTWIFLKAGRKPANRSFFTRLYDKKTISAALKKSGFKPLKFWGDFKGHPLTPKKNRLIVLAVKDREREKAKRDKG